MKQLSQVFRLIITLCLVLGAVTLASAQSASQTPTTPAATQGQSAQPEQAPAQTPQQQYPGQSGQPSQSAPPSAPQTEPPGQQAPGSQARSAQQVQTFTGTIVKSGDKYVLQDATTGTAYDIDHQDLVAQHAGRKVRVSGTLDADGKTIHLQPSTHQ